MTARFRQIDDQNRNDHFHITEDDECYFLYEYTAHKGFSFSDTNQLISNLKKRRGQGGFQYKAPAIRRCAAALTGAIVPSWLKTAVLVPTPPSKIETDPDYDDRITQICKLIAGADVREVVKQTLSMPPSHAGQRHTPEELKDAYCINESCVHGLPTNIGVVDDMLTAGAHFRAMKDTLLQRFPNAKVVGLFVTRRMLPNPFEGLEISDDWD